MSKPAFLFCFLIGLSACVSGGAQAPAGSPAQAAAQTATPDRIAEGNRFYDARACRRVYIQTPSFEEARREAQAQSQRPELTRGDFGVYQLFNGDFIAAAALENYSEDGRRLARSGSRADRNRNIQLAIRRGDAHPTARGMDGSEIARDTGYHYVKEWHGSNGGLIGAVIEGVAVALRDAGQHMDGAPVTAMEPTQADPAPTAAPSATAAATPRRGVQSIVENGRVDGNTAYRITCANGRTHRIWRSSGEWWDGRGPQGGQPRGLEAQAALLCD
jgi:hypothetical protein